SDRFPLSATEVAYDVGRGGAKFRAAWKAERVRRMWVPRSQARPAPHPLPGSSGEKPLQPLLRVRREAEGQLAADLDDRPPHPPPVLREPGDQLLAGEPVRLRAPLGRDQLLRAAGLLRQRAKLGGRERLLDQVALFDLLLLSREELPRLHAARSA